MFRLGILGVRVRENCVDFIFHSAWPSGRVGENGKKQLQITDLHTAVSKLDHVRVVYLRQFGNLESDYE